MNGPVPLANEGSGMMIPLLIACCSSLSSSVGGFLMKDKIAAMLGGKKTNTVAGTGRTVRVRRRSARQPPKGAFDSSGGAAAARARASQRRAAQQRASAARRRAAGARRRQMAARRRAAASRRRRAAGARKRMMAARRRRAARIARKMKRKMKRFRFGRRGRRMRRRFGRRGRKMGRRGRKMASRAFRRMRRRFRCFSPETSVKLQNGDTRPMKNLKLGDVLINGSIVEATLKIRNQNDPYYKLPGDILVTGSHYIKDGSTYKHVSKFSKAEATTQIDDVVCCLVTSDHKIPVGDFVFWDWEDNLVPNHGQQTTKVMTLRNRNKTLNSF